MQGHLGLTLVWYRTTRREMLYTLNSKHLSQVILKKNISEYFYVLLWFNLGPTGEGHLGPWDICLNISGLGPTGRTTSICANSG